MAEDNNIDILFSARTPGKILTRLKRKNFFAPEKIFFGLLLFLLLFFSAALLLQKQNALLYELPVGSKAYIAYNLDKSDRFFFWQKRASKESAVKKLSSFILMPDSLRAIWPDLLPQLSGRAELAYLPGGDFILRARVKNEKDFLNNESLTFPQGIRGKARDEQKIFSAKTNGRRPVYWRRQGGVLDISSTASWRGELTDSGFSQLVEKYASPGDDLIVYAADAAGLTRLSGRPLVFFLAEFDFPFLLRGQEKEGKLILTAGKAQKNNLRTGLERQLASDQPAQSGDFLYFNTRSFNKSFYNWLDALALRQAESAQAVSALQNGWQEFYDFDLTSILALGDNLNLSVFVKQDSGDNYWAVMLDAGTEEDREAIQSSLEKLGRRLFAASHPIRTEKTLSDNTNMTELRAEYEDLSWQNLNLSREFGEPAEFLFLAGQGEETGVYLGVLSGEKIAFTNSPAFLFDNLAFYRQNAGASAISDIYFNYPSGKIFKNMRWQEEIDGLWRGEIVF